MKQFTLVVLFFLSFCMDCKTQVSIKSEYFGTSGYRDEHNERVGDSKGSALTYQASVNLPFSMKVDEKHRPTIWGLGLAGTYVSLDNKNFTEHLVLSEIMNLQLSLFHLRPISEKWSVMATLGVGIYTDNTRFSRIRFRNVLGGGAFVFIRRMFPSLDLGAGVALNNAFGYPMLFPALYVNWNYDGKFTFRFSALDGMNLLAGYNVNKSLSLNIVTEMGGQMAMTEVKGKEKIFTHQYIVAGFRPEFKIADRISIPVTVGVNAMRAAFYDDRSLSALFKSMGREYDPCFQVSPYVSAGIVFNLK